MSTDSLTINSIGDLQIALNEDNNDAIKNYIERLDRETANTAMQKAGEFFGFPTVEVEGAIRTSAGHLARVFGYKKPHALQELLATRGIFGIKLGGFTQETCSFIKQSLNLEERDFSSVLYDWPAFLIGGMNSTNDEAKQVQTYLLRMEKVARIGIVSVKQGALTSTFPEPAHGIVMAKLAKQAWSGSPIAAYILEQYYNVPVKQLMHRTDPELSETSGLIAQYLHFTAEGQVSQFGLKIISTTDGGYKITGMPDELYQSFLYVSRRHHLTQFFSSQYSLGSLLGREADALETLGWRRSMRKITGYSHYTYEYIPKQAEEPFVSVN